MENIKKVHSLELFNKNTIINSLEYKLKMEMENASLRIQLLEQR